MGCKGVFVTRTCFRDVIVSDFISTSSCSGGGGCSSKISSIEPTVFKKGTATLIISVCYKKELFKPWILIPVSSKYVENLEVLLVGIFAYGL